MGLMKWVGFFMVLFGLAIRLAVDYMPESLPLSEIWAIVVSVLLILVGAILAVKEPRRIVAVPA